MATNRNRRLWLTLGGVALVLLAAGIFTLGSLRTPLQPEVGNAFIALFALSTFIFAAFLIFGLVLLRSFIRLWSERRAGQLGARFKTKMLYGAMGVSLLPVVFLFFFSYALVNRTLNQWFPRPLEISQGQARELLDEVAGQDYARLRQIAADASAQRMQPADVISTFGNSVNAAWLLDGAGKPTYGEESVNRQSVAIAQNPSASASGVKDIAKRVRQMENGAEIWSVGADLYLGARAPADGGEILVGRRLPDDFLDRLTTMEEQNRVYLQQREQIRTYKKEILLTLLLITVLLLSATTWVAQFLAKQVTVPIQAMAEATQEVARGNFDYRVGVKSNDELGTLVSSFNQMTEQLGDSRRQIEAFTQNLQQAFEERERRRQLMEAILENIPTGVISLSPSGEILRANAAAVAILGQHAKDAKTLDELMGVEAASEIETLMRRGLRLGVATREMELQAQGHTVNAAVTVSALGTRRENPGFLLVIDDLTELLRAQKAAAWQEVARRIAHEIKNPLTPIQLSAQRLQRQLERMESMPGAAVANTSSDFTALVAECSRLIQQEVSTLASLVDEFSQFVRFPAAQLEPSDANAIVVRALETFAGRLEGITLTTDLASNLPGVRADSELLRRVLVNLVDNAAEALEGAPLREIAVSTRLDARGGAVEIIVADSGPGISSADREKLFLPQFSTKKRGTGLGLAIASRIVAEHNGTLRAEPNSPQGARFVLRLPAMETAAPAAVAHAIATDQQ